MLFVRTLHFHKLDGAECGASAQNQATKLFRFSVKTMVIMKLLQQQNGNTVVVEKFKSEFYVEI